MSGVELSEPHWHHGRAEALLRDVGLDWVLASVHSAPAGVGFTEISDCFRDQSPAQVLRAYLAEVTALISQFDDFEVLAHDPATLAAGFTEAAQMAEAAGFTASRDPCGPWGRNVIPAL